MRTAGLPNFRKLYGKIDSDFSSGDVLSFNVTLNFEVTSFGGSKSLVVTNLGYNGRYIRISIFHSSELSYISFFHSKSKALGNSFIIVGVLSMVVGCVLLAKRLLFPRPLGDISALEWVK